MNRTWLILVLGLSLAACQQSGPPTSSAQEPTVTTSRWSDPQSWPGGSLPASGDDVTIPKDMAMLLDVSPPPLGGLSVEGALVFDEQDLELTAEWIMVHGKLEVGSAQRPFAQRAVITLTGGDEDVMGMGGKFLGAMGGGLLQLYGAAKTSWTRLAANAEAGDTEILLEQAPTWQPGERIVIASTNFDFEQAETFTVVRVEGQRVFLDAPVGVLHWGETMSYEGRSLNERAEVGLLTRNILVQGDAHSEVAGFGGHTMIMMGGRAFLHGVEFYRMGQQGRVARYPVHWHLMGDDAEGSFLENSSIHHSFSRCVTIHGSNGVRIEDNVAYRAAGHCFFLEDGAEVGNVFTGNLGLSTYEPEEGSALLPSDTGFPGPATFWITNPDNRYRDNVAAGSAGTGFWIALPEHPTGFSADPEVWPRYTPLGEFARNTAHSSGSDGLHLDRGPRADPEAGLEVAYYRPSQNPSEVDEHGRNASSPVTAVFEDFTAYKNRNRGVWLRGENHLLLNPVLADNAIGATFASDESGARGGLFVGESANKGAPTGWELEQGRAGPDGRSIPKPWKADFPIRGFEFYDGTVGVEDSHFAAFAPNALRSAAALSYLDFTAFAAEPTNFAAGLSFAEGTARAYLASRPVPSDPDEGEDGYRSAVFEDRDGSVTGTAGAHVVVNNPFLATLRCALRLAWNAYVCPERYAALTLENEDAAPLELNAVTLQRADGRTHTLLGAPHVGPNTRFRSSVLLGESYRYSLGGELPAHLRLHLGGVTSTDSLQVSLPYAASEVYLYRDWWIDARNRVQPAASLEELKRSTGDRYYLSNGVLHLKLQPRPGEGERGSATLDLCQRDLCR